MLRRICMQRSISRHLSSNSSPATQRAEAVLNQLTNYEQQGVPARAGTDSAEGFDLARVHALLTALGQPQSHWRAVHIAGTKGKGSTAALLSCILSSAGCKVGTYTSPHLSTIRERIVVNGQPIAEPAFESLVTRHESSLHAPAGGSRGPPTWFEAVTALAYQHFRDEAVDLGVVEVGLGGARDATNVFTPEQLALAIITPISLEHSAALGGSLESITDAKAGIMKAGRPVVIAPQPHQVVADRLRQRAAQLGCSVVESGDYVRLEPGPSSGHASGRPVQACTLQFRDSAALPDHSSAELQLRVLGAHQLGNAALAATAALLLRQQGWERITGAAICAGLQQASLPGRFQVQQLPPDSTGYAPTLVLDGAHTPESAAALAATLRSCFPDSPLALVVAMAGDKDAAGILAALRAAKPNVALFTTAQIAGSSARSAAPGAMLAHWQAAGMAQRPPLVRCRELVQASVRGAVERARSELRAHAGRGVICVCGSLHAAADALRSLDLRAAPPAGQP